MNSFANKLAENNINLKRRSLVHLQVNLGKLCNQFCLHCHVEAGPNKKKENMDKDAVDRILSLIKKSPQIESVDITGGAPELNPHFRYFVKELRKLDIAVIDRCNLTVLFEKNQEDTAEFLKEHQVDIFASLPCYDSKNVDKQRGDGVFNKSIKALKILNSLGYGQEHSSLNLNLVYNPQGASLPPDQSALEKEYKQRLFNDFDIKFNSLFTITNMPIKRFLYDLKREKKYEDYMSLLSSRFNHEAAKNVMCCSLISIGWDGQIFDCDFNQMLNLKIDSLKEVKELSIWNISSFDEFLDLQIRTASHCFACTAGSGSSCQGTIK